TLERLGELAKERGLSLHKTAELVRANPSMELPEKARGDLEEFLELVESFRSEMLGRRNLAAKVRALLEAIDYRAWLVTDNLHNEKAAKWKLLNVESLVNGIDVWEKDPDNHDPTLFAWLNRISLITRDDMDDEEDSGKVNLMTVHAAKGLEFEIVFIAGCEDGIMPHARSLEEGEGNLEEERRLFYVAVTRARRRLHISSAMRRRRNAMPVDCVPSPFLAEIPEKLVTWYEGEGDLAPDDAEDFFAKMNSMFPGEAKEEE
ncbi:MAG TPA: ATP-dependent helicase, partial [Spirochaetales bacterium]|nr:ATP-dependent helicase [Spirochaetales bacterium]